MLLDCPRLWERQAETKSRRAHFLVLCWGLAPSWPQKILFLFKCWCCSTSTSLKWWVQTGQWAFRELKWSQINSVLSNKKHLLWKMSSDFYAPNNLRPLRDCTHTSSLNCWHKPWRQALTGDSINPEFLNALLFAPEFKGYGRLLS